MDRRGQKDSWMQMFCCKARPQQNAQNMAIENKQKKKDKKKRKKEKQGLLDD